MFVVPGGSFLSSFLENHRRGGRQELVRSHASVSPSSGNIWDPWTLSRLFISRMSRDSKHLEMLESLSKQRSGMGWLWCQKKWSGSPLSFWVPTQQKGTEKIILGVKDSKCLDECVDERGNK